MTDTPTKPPVSTTRVWTVVREHLDRFARAWSRGDTPPDLAAFAPAGSPELRQVVLVELVKFDLDCRLQRQLLRPVEAYLEEFPELNASGGPPCDLIYEEFQLRCRSGTAPDPADYYRRFPTRAAELARLLESTQSPRTTSVYATRAPETVRPGDKLDDFDLLALLGEGQFAKVFLARQQSMQRLVALKVSQSRGAEAETLARLDHPNIVRVYDQRFLADRGLLLVYMPYLAGGTLYDVLVQVKSEIHPPRPPLERGGASTGFSSSSRRVSSLSGRTLLAAVDAALERRGELPPAASAARQQWAGRSWPATVCALGAKLAAALDYAHRQEVLHRDVKPANVLLTAEGEPMLADFNVGCCSKVEGAGPAAFIGGSLAYMSAEHLEAFDPDHPRAPESLDGRTDIFGLAVTLWELATGRRPFDAEALAGSWYETLGKLIAQRKAGPPPEAVAAFEDGDAVGFKDVLLRCLDADPARRPATAAMFARELELCLRPATRALVRPAAGGWMSLIRRWPVLTLLPLGLAPNAFASLFNISYNRAEIIAQWPAAETVFDTIIMIVNGIFFPVGLILMAGVIHHVTRGLRYGVEPAANARRRWLCLRLGELAAGVCVGCWLIAGIVWPITLRIVAGPPPEGPTVHIHFVISLAVCGLIAGAYPYFLVTFLSVRVLYPALLGRAGPTAEDTPALQRVVRQLSFFRAIAAAVPLVAVALLASRNVTLPFAVIVLSVAGLAGSLLAFGLEGRIRNDIAALTET